MPIDPSYQVVLDYQQWLNSLIKPRAIKADSHEHITKPENSKTIIITDDD